MMQIFQFENGAYVKSLFVIRQFWINVCINTFSVHQSTLYTLCKHNDKYKNLLYWYFGQTIGKFFNFFLEKLWRMDLFFIFSIVLVFLYAFYYLRIRKKKTNFKKQLNTSQLVYCRRYCFWKVHIEKIKQKLSLLISILTIFSDITKKQIKNSI